MNEFDPIRVAVTGASGLLGRQLRLSLERDDHTVLPLVRRRPRPGTSEIGWDPASGVADARSLEGVDALVHLAGESLYGRWTAAKKRRIRGSRIDGTRRIAQALAGLDRPPAALITASAVGYYGDRGSETMTEASPPGAGFLADVCRDWEAATEPASAAGIRVVRLRIALVLTDAGGALRKMLPAFRLGLGAVIGSGRQYMSWIGLEDMIRVVRTSLIDERLVGPINLAAPQPVTNEEFSRALARVLGRPLFLRVPSWMIETALGEMGRETLLSSTRVRPARLEEIGFRFHTPDIDSALEKALDPPPADDS